MRRFDVHDAAARLPRLIELVEAGEEIVIERSGQPVARLVAPGSRLPVVAAFGASRGPIRLRGDFDELPDEFASHFR